MNQIKNMYRCHTSKIPKNSRILINAFVSPKEWKDRIFFPDNETYFVKELMKISDRVILASLGLLIC